MSFYGDVYETIIDGQSGIVVDGDPFAIVVGTCTTGEIGKMYVVGKSTDLSAKLGAGRLVDRINDFFLKAPSDTVLIAIPTEKDIAGSVETITVGSSNTGKGTVASSGSATRDADVIAQVVSGGALNEATIKYSVDGGDNWSEEETIPATGKIVCGDTGITLTFSEYASVPAESFVSADTFTFSTTSPKSSLTAIMAGLNAALETYTPEACWIAQGCDKVYWSALGVLADSLFEDHRPCWMYTEAELPAGSLDDYVNNLVSVRNDFAHRFVHVCAQVGEITEKSGSVPFRNVAGLVMGIVANARVNQSIGEVRVFGISNVTLPDEWTGAFSKTLDDAGYIVLRKYAGLSSTFVSNARSLADSTSDYQFLEVTRTVFRAIKLSRIAALKNLQGPGDKLGVTTAKNDIDTALSVMTSAFPKELDSYDVVVPDGQDVVNNGLAYELELFGIPILRKIKLFFLFKYANPFAS